MIELKCCGQNGRSDCRYCGSYDTGTGGGTELWRWPVVVAIVAARGVAGRAIASATIVLDITEVDAGVFDDNMCKRRRPLRTWAGSHCVGGDYGGDAPAGDDKDIVTLVAAEVAADCRGGGWGCLCSL